MSAPTHCGWPMVEQGRSGSTNTGSVDHWRCADTDCTHTTTTKA